MSNKQKLKMTLNENYLMSILQRPLTKKEMKMIKKVRSEKKNNLAIERIHKKALTNNLYIPCLTRQNGDCLFESLEHVGLCESSEEMRQISAMLFFLFGNCKLVDSYDATLKSIFEMTNEIPYVYCHNNNKMYKYTYYTMCVDMYTPGSWSRLPTEILLTVLSSFFKVRFRIHHDSGNVTTICTDQLNKTLPLDDPSCNITLGLIDESHYIPLIPLDKKVLRSIKLLQYTDEHRKFINWMKKIEDGYKSNNNVNEMKNKQKQINVIYKPYENYKHENERVESNKPQKFMKNKKLVVFA